MACFKYLACLFLLFASAGNALSQTSGSSEAGMSFSERQCVARDWRRETIHADTSARTLLWRAPESGWTRGAIVILHGGGGQAYQWCVVHSRMAAPQVRFAERALGEGYAVFLLNASGLTTDEAGRACGAVWDDEMRPRRNFDLPALRLLIEDFIPSVRPRGARNDVFLTGHS